MATEAELAETVAELKKERDELRRGMANTQAGLVLVLVVALLALAVAGYGAFAHAPRVRGTMRADTLETHRLVVKDERGRVRAELSTAPAESVAAFESSTQKPIKVFMGSSASLWFQDEAGNCGLTLGQANEGRGGFVDVLESLESRGLESSAGLYLDGSTVSFWRYGRERAVVDTSGIRLSPEAQR